MHILLFKLPYCPHPGTAKPADFRTTSSFRPVPSLGLAALAAYIDKYVPGHTVEAVDLNIEAYAEPGEPIETGDYPVMLESILRHSKYDVLGLSAMFVYNVKWVEDAIALVRKYRPKARIILGGGYPTLFPERCGVERVRGEGEAAFAALLGNQPHVYGDFLDLARLPVPAWDKLDVEHYFQASGDRILPIEGSRGCPYGCSYCCVDVAWGKRVRYKPVENLYAEVCTLAERYGVRALHFVDDNFTFNKQWAMSFLKRMQLVPHRPELCFSNLSIKHLDPEIVDLLVQSGVRQFNIAIETGSPEMQKRIGKCLDLDKARAKVAELKRMGLHVHICWMLGFPGETLAQIQQTLALARELRAHSNQFLTVLPYPGTRLFAEAQAAGLLKLDGSRLDQFDCRGGDYLISSEWTYEQLRDMIYDANIEMNFLKNPWLETADGRERFKGFLSGLVQRLPQHVMAHILLGYLGKDGHFSKARVLMADPGLNRVFAKYITGDNAVTRAFLEAT